VMHKGISGQCNLVKWRKDELPIETQQSKKKKGKSKNLNASELQLLGFLPGVVWIAKVPIGGSLQILRFLEVKLADYKAISARLRLIVWKTHSPMTPGRRSQFLRMISTSSSSDFLPVPYEST